MSHEPLIDAMEDVHPAFIAFAIGTVTGLLTPELGMIQIGIIATILAAGIKLVLWRVTDASGKDSNII